MFKDRFQNLHRVEQPIEGVGSQQGAACQVTQTLVEGPQSSDEVSAVDRGDVLGPERLEGAQVVPIQQVPLITFELSQGVECLGEPFDRLIEGEIAEVAGRQRAEQPHSNVGRAGSQR